MPRLIAVFALALVLALSAGCGPGNTTAPQPANGPDPGHAVWDMIQQQERVRIAIEMDEQLRNDWHLLLADKPAVVWSSSPNVAVSATCVLIQKAKAAERLLELIDDPGLPRRLDPTWRGDDTVLRSQLKTLGKEAQLAGAKTMVTLVDHPVEEICDTGSYPQFNFGNPAQTYTMLYRTLYASATGPEPEEVGIRDEELRRRAVKSIRKTVPSLVVMAFKHHPNNKEMDRKLQAKAQLKDYLDAGFSPKEIGLEGVDPSHLREPYVSSRNGMNAPSRGTIILN